MKDKTIIVKILKCTVSLLTLLGTVVYFMGMTFGWFASNKDVSGDGMGAQFGSEKVTITKVEATGVGEVDPATMNVKLVNAEPGDKSLITVTFIAKEDLSTLDFIFEAPEGCETPVKKGKKFYYFSSQIMITKLMYDSIDITEAPLNEMLLANKTMDTKYGWASATEIKPIDRVLYNGVNLPRGEHTFTFELTFFNSDFDQGVLKNFGKNPSQVFYRKFVLVPDKPGVTP